MTINRIVIIGAGAVGGCIGGLLNEANLPVTLIARGEHGKKIRELGLTVKFPNRNIVGKPSCFDSIEQLEWAPYDMVIVATKLYDVESVMDTIAKSAGSGVPVVCAFNGLHGEQWAAERFETVLSMLIWMPSTYLQPGEVLVYGKDCPGVLDIGPTNGTHSDRLSSELCDQLTTAGFDAAYRSDIKKWKYAKWITNLGNTAQALIVDDWKPVAMAAQAEGELVLDTANVSRVKTGELLERASKIKLKPIDNEPRPGGSTWQSFHRDKPLETPWIEGAMASLADQFKVPAPINRFLSNLATERRTATASEAFEFQRDNSTR